MDQPTVKKQIAHTLIALVIICVMFWATQIHRTVTVDSGFQITMGTYVHILAVAPNHKQGQAAVKEAVAKVDQIDDMMSDYDVDSALSSVNKAAFDHPVKVPAELFKVLAAAVEYSKSTDGAFDITIGPVVQLWRKAKESGIGPTEEQIQAAGAAVGYQYLILDAKNQTVRFAKDGMFLDLGGIAKGYAIDQAVEVLQAAGLKGGMVDIGGDLRCFGDAANGAAHWLIGLQDPVHPDDQDNILLTLNADNRAVATSGDYRRFVLIEGQKHSHIVNPQTADAADDLSSVTIIAETAMGADALATAVTVLGNEKGLALIETIPNTEAFVIEASKDAPIQKTSGADQHVMP